MNLTPRFPAGPPTTVDMLLAEVDAAEWLSVGDDRVRQFLLDFSRRLLQPTVARRFPELGSLGFFLRRSEIDRALDSIAERAAGRRRVPRGLVLHFPPANVDTIFVYSWALSALAGNANLVRISPRTGGAAQRVLDILTETLAGADPVIAATQRMFTYERDDAITARLCAACDLRVIWGGDASVTDIRRHPLAPLSRDVVFPDRSSFAIIRLAAWSAATEAERLAAVEGFANDLYWFDQAACSSPRTLFWVGDGAARPPAQEQFVALLEQVVRNRGWSVDAAMAVEKYVATFGLAADGAATTVRFAGNAIANVELADPAFMPRHWLGAGTLAHADLATLTDVVPLVRRKDQTLTQFGFATGELDELMLALGGRGIDRVVPFGSALSFAAVWDGYDLLREFTRLTTVSAA
jgi:hypothetical protein